MKPAVGEVNDEADREPHEETNPGFQSQRKHHRKTHNDAEDRSERNKRGFVGPGPFGMEITQHQHTGANDDEGKKRSDARHVAQFWDGKKSGKEADEYHEENVGTPGRVPARMDVGENFG